MSSQAQLAILVSEEKRRLSEGLVERREGTWNTAERWCSETAAAVLPRKDPNDVSTG